MLGKHPVILATPGPSKSVLALGVDWEAVTQMRATDKKKKGFMMKKIFLAFRICAYPGDLNVVQLLLPVKNALHPVHPHVDVSNQDRLADALN